MKNKLMILVVVMFLMVSISVAQAKPMVKMVTSMGDIVIELNQELATNTIKNFMKYVKEGHYDGTVFHRVINNFMIQGGGFKTGMVKKTGGHSPIKNEAYNGLKNSVGTIAMARTNAPHSATDQFFLNVNNNKFLNFKSKTSRGWGYAVFGKVIKGMDVVNKIKGVKTGNSGHFQNVPKKDIIIKSIKEIVEKKKIVKKAVIKKSVVKKNIKVEKKVAAPVVIKKAIVAKPIVKKASTPVVTKKTVVKPIVKKVVAPVVKKTVIKTKTLEKSATEIIKKETK